MPTAAQIAMDEAMAAIHRHKDTPHRPKATSATALLPLTGPQRWAELHRRAGLSVADPDAERAWIASLASGLEGCSCNAHWKALLDRMPPRLDDYARWTWEAHNEVNKRLGKPLFPFEAIGRVQTSPTPLRAVSAAAGGNWLDVYARKPNGPALGDRDWKAYFGRSIVVNLDIAPDRLQVFYDGLSDPWPLPSVERVRGVEGGKVGVPSRYPARGGLGGYGLYRTYTNVIEDAIMSGYDKPIVLFEDDCAFVPNFANRFAERMRNVPENWDMLWIGGEHRNRVHPVADGVVLADGPHRTHSFAVHPRFFKSILQIWHERCFETGHVDHAVTDIADRFNIYALKPFLTAQRAGHSYIGPRRSLMHAWDHETTQWMYEGLQRPPLHLYIHVAQMNGEKWRKILAEQLKKIERWGLAEEATVTLGVVGDEPIVAPAWATVARLGSELRRFEYPTLELLEAHARREPKAYFCYSHLKGVSVDATDHDHWRTDISDFTFRIWRERVAELGERHTSGPRFTAGGAGWHSEYVQAHGHYSGNFWWARGDYLASLPPLSSFDQRNRMYAEAWIGQSPQVNQLISR